MYSKLRQVMSLAEQVGECEADVEGGVAEVDDFVVQEDQPVVVDEDVLGAVVAMDEAVRVARVSATRL